MPHRQGWGPRVARTSCRARPAWAPCRRWLARAAWPGKPGSRPSSSVPCRCSSDGTTARNVRSTSSALFPTGRQKSGSPARTTATSALWCRSFQASTRCVRVLRNPIPERVGRIILAAASCWAPRLHAVHRVHSPLRRRRPDQETSPPARLREPNVASKRANTLTCAGRARGYTVQIHSGRRVAMRTRPAAVSRLSRERKQLHRGRGGRAAGGDGRRSVPPFLFPACGSPRLFTHPALTSRSRRWQIQTQLGMSLLPHATLTLVHQWTPTSTSKTRRPCHRTCNTRSLIVRPRSGPRTRTRTRTDTAARPNTHI